jgi:hypothetical protein
MNIAILIDCWKDYPKNLFQKILFNLWTSRRMYWHIKKFLESNYDINTIIIASYDDKETTSIISNIKKKNILYITDLNEFECFLKENKIEGIFICGSAMDVCVKNRPLGYISIFNLIKKLNLNTNIFLKYNCVKYMDNSYFKIERELDWDKTDNPYIFKYNPYLAKNKVDH